MSQIHRLQKTSETWSTKILLFYLRRLWNSTGIGFWLRGNRLGIDPLDLIFSWLRGKCLLVQAVEVGMQKCSFSREPFAIEIGLSLEGGIEYQTLGHRQAFAPANREPCCQRSSSWTLSGCRCSTLERSTARKFLHFQSMCLWLT